MEIVKRELKALEQIETPEVLYKYRNFTNKYHIGILSEREIFFAPPTSFEDKLDCKIPIRYDLLNHQDIFDKYLMDSKEFNKNFSRQQHREWARKWAENSPLRDKILLEKRMEQEFHDYDKRIGILSLTENNSSIEMWNKYSDDQSGFCVGFHAKRLFEFLGGGGPVVYMKELPTIMPRPKHSFDKQRYLRVFSKLDCWSFEEEYRTLIFGKNELTISSRKKQIPKEVYKEIIVGRNISNENMNQVQKIISEVIGDVDLRKQSIDANGIITIE